MNAVSLQSNAEYSSTHTREPVAEHYWLGASNRLARGTRTIEIPLLPGLGAYSGDGL